MPVLLAVPLAAQDPPPPPPVPAPQQERVHVVRPGDTLWDLARSYLSDPFLWPEIFRINADLIRDPALIYPAERLRLPGAPGMMVMEPDQTRVEPGRTVFFREEQSIAQRTGPAIRAAGSQDVPVLPPGEFFAAGLLIDEGELPAIGRLADVLAPSVVQARLAPMIELYDKVFVVLDDPAAVRIGDRLHFFREGRRIKPYGRDYMPTGIATIAALDGNTATAVMVQLFDLPRLGDLAVPLPEFPVAAGVLPREASGLDGEIVAFASPHPVQSTKDLLYVNVGDDAGVAEGDEFIAYLPPDERKGWVRPAVDVARLQVVRVAGRTATTRVIELTYPAVEVGMPIRLVGKMP